MELLIALKGLRLHEREKPNDGARAPWTSTSSSMNRIIQHPLGVYTQRCISGALYWSHV